MLINTCMCVHVYVCVCVCVCVYEWVCVCIAVCEPFCVCVCVSVSVTVLVVVWLCVCIVCEYEWCVCKVSLKKIFEFTHAWIILKSKIITYIFIHKLFILNLNLYLILLASLKIFSAAPPINPTKGSALGPR